MRRVTLWALSVGITVLVPKAMCAQPFPTKPIRVVTGAPGSSAEFIARTVGQEISIPLGQPVVVDARVGGGGTVFGEMVARSPPDGYTLVLIGSSIWIGPLMRKAPYDPLRDFSPISILADSPNILVVYPSLLVKSVRDLIDLAKSKPGTLNYSTSSIGSSPHLAAELFKAMTGVDIVHVPFKGAGASVVGVMTGQVQLSFASAPSAAPHISSGRLRALAVTSARPSTLFPDLPTVAATVPGYDTGGVTVLLAPARTPAAIVDRLNREVVRALKRDDVREKFMRLGLEVVGSSPAELAATMRTDTAKWGKVIRDAHIRLD